jgi:hypothetical protein
LSEILVSTYPVYQWELYNLDKDAGETKNVAEQFPLIVDELAEEYFKWADKSDVVDYDKIKPAGGFVIPGQSAPIK